MCYHEEPAQCSRCGETFYRKHDEKWKRLCLDCWKDQKNSTTGSSIYAPSGADYRTMYNNARDRAERLLVENLRLKDQIRSIAVGSKEQRFLRSNLMTLIALCHPDRHGGNSVAANKITRELLEIREGMR